MPKETLQLLEKLRLQGFRDSDFQVIHQFEEKVSIQAHIDYCDEVTRFNKGCNRTLKQRIKYIHQGAMGGRVDFLALSREAKNKYPF